MLLEFAIFFWIFLIVVPQGFHILLKAPWNVNRTIKIKKAELNVSEVNISDKPRLNVIIMTHQGSVSSFIGNLFSLHPEVFYHFKPLSGLSGKKLTKTGIARARGLS